MNASPATKLYAVEPHSERLLRWLRSAVEALISLHWAFFQAWGYLALSLLAAVFIGAGIIELRHAPHRWYLALPSIGLGLAFFINARVRQFAWAVFGFGVVWFILVTVALVNFGAPQRPIASPVVSAFVLALYAFPPLIAGWMATYGKRPKA